jgi:hypothetical protein
MSTKTVNRRSSKPAGKNTKKPAKKGTRGDAPLMTGTSVAYAVGRALMRKPRVNPALLKAFRANRDLLRP